MNEAHNSNWATYFQSDTVETMYNFWDGLLVHVCSSKTWKSFLSEKTLLFLSCFEVGRFFSAIGEHCCWKIRPESEFACQSMHIMDDKTVDLITRKWRYPIDTWGVLTEVILEKADAISAIVGWSFRLFSVNFTKKSRLFGFIPWRTNLVWTLRWTLWHALTNNTFISPTFDLVTRDRSWS